LHATGKRELLLSGATLAASAADPAMSIGADLRDGLPRGPEAATLRRLGVEIEMWLHENRINRERQSRGELPVSGLWLWGATTQSAPDSGARRPIAPPSRSGPLPQHARLFGEDAYMESLWRLRGSPLRRCRMVSSASADPPKVQAWCCIRHWAPQARCGHSSNSSSAGWRRPCRRCAHAGCRP